MTVVRGDKVDVAFKAETKTLVHGRGGAPAERPAFQPPSTNKPAGTADKPQAPGSEVTEDSESETNSTSAPSED